MRTLSLSFPRRLIAVSFLSALAVSAVGYAQPTPRTAKPAREHPSVTLSRTETAPRIDGVLTDALWARATKISNFLQERPIELAPATEATDVFLAYDSQNLYVGIHAHYGDRSIMRANRADRDQTGSDDTVTVFFDPFLDQQRGYAFSVNAYGVQGDSLLASSGGGGDMGGMRPGNRRNGPGDPSWDTLYRSAGAMTEDGWTAEMAIPFKSLRYPARASGQPHRWGFQIQREIRSKNEADVWSPMSRDVMGFLAQMGTIEGMTDLSTSRNLEVLPTATTVLSESRSTTTGAMDGIDVEEMGVSVKYGITSNLTLDGTFNPDFSQIESDRQQIAVNQRFPLVYPELRPFFLEGQEIFSIPAPVQLVNTRTIVDPKYGLKLTGKTGKTTVGLVVADDESAGKFDATGDAVGRSAQNLIARVRYDLYPESSVGVIVTDREFLSSYSRLVGADAQFRIGRNQQVGMRLFGEQHQTQAGVSTSGYVIDASFRKQGRGLAYSANYVETSPDFKTDIGYVRRTDVREGQASVSYRWWPQNWIINWGPRLNYNRMYMFSGPLQDSAVNLGWNAQFDRNISANVNIDTGMERYNGIDFDKTRYGYNFNVNTSRKLQGGGYGNFGDQIRYVTVPYLGKGTSSNFFVTLRPNSRLQTELTLTTSDFTNTTTQTKEFNIHIWRALTTYQFTPRLLLRNIVDYNNYDRTLGGNLLLTYRVNSGTAFYLGYDDRYRDGSQFASTVFPNTDYVHINRAVFAKLQVLLRY